MSPKRDDRLDSVTESSSPAVAAVSSLMLMCRLRRHRVVEGEDEELTMSARAQTGLQQAQVMRRRGFDDEIHNQREKPRKKTPNEKRRRKDYA